MLGISINVGSSTSKKTPNGRGRIFNDFRFEYLPIPEIKRTIVKIPTYRKLGFQRARLYVSIDYRLKKREMGVCMRFCKFYPLWMTMLPSAIS